MQVKTARFGTVDVDENLVITIPDGLLGFPDDTTYCILRPNDEGAFYWLQSCDSPELAFVVTDPTMFVPEYAVPIRSDQASDLRIESEDDALILVIVNKVGDTLTANLQGPLVCNTEARVAQQLVLAEKRWTTRHLLMKLDEAPQHAPVQERVPA